MQLQCDWPRRRVVPSAPRLLHKKATPSPCTSKSTSEGTDPVNSQGYTMEQQNKDEKCESSEQALGKPRAPDQEGS